MQLRPTEIVRHGVVELLFRLRRPELLGDGDAVRVADVLHNLPAQGAVADGFETRLQVLKAAVLGQP